jgi:Dolichyl-phosphate-mannose-protein mannosyltransferase
MTRQAFGLRLRVWLRRQEQAESTLTITSLVLIFAFYIWRFRLLKTVSFNPDEFWHLHTAWCLSRGLIPYRDFFEHHTPWLYFLLAPLFRFYRTDTDPNAAISFIFLARGIMMVIAGIALVMTFLLAHLWRGNRVAWLAVALLSTSVVFAHKTLEVRPDVPAMVLWVGCLAALVRATDEHPLRMRKQKWLFVLSGFLMGGAVMSAQKMLVMLPSFTLAMLWYLAAGKGTNRTRFFNCLFQLSGFCAPIIATSIFFWAHGALWPFIKYNLMNIGWRTRFPAYYLAPQVIAQNPVLAALGILGILCEVPTTFHEPAFTADKLLLLNTVGAIGAVFVMPTPWTQNYLTSIPLLAIYSGALLAFLADKIFRSERGLKQVGLKVPAALALSLVACSISLFSAQGTLWADLVSGVLLLTGIGLIFRRRLRGAALALVLIAFSVHPYCQMNKEFSSTNALQLKRLRFVLANTLPTDTVMDGWSGLGVFRPHAWFYPFIHGEIQALLSAEDRQQLLLGLRSGRIAPKFVFPNAAMMSISRPVTAFLLTHYYPVGGDPNVRRRNVINE